MYGNTPLSTQTLQGIYSLSGFKAIPVLSRPLQASKAPAEVVSFRDTFARKLKSPAYR